MIPQSKIPPEIANQLGKPGSQALLKMLIKLTPFAHNAAFGREAFGHIVAFDAEKNQLLPPETCQNMLDVALSTGILTAVSSKKGEKYIFHVGLHHKMQTLFDRGKS